MPEKSREKEEKSHAEKNEGRPLVVGAGRIEKRERRTREDRDKDTYT